VRQEMTNSDRRAVIRNLGDVFSNVVIEGQLALLCEEDDRRRRELKIESTRVVCSAD
jgi:hypothetical protein